MAGKKRQIVPTPTQGLWEFLGKVIDFLTQLMPSADKDMKANMFVDISMVLIYILIWQFILAPAFSRLGSGAAPLMIFVVLIALYFGLWKALQACFDLFIQKLRRKGYFQD